MMIILRGAAHLNSTGSPTIERPGIDFNISNGLFNCAVVDFCKQTPLSNRALTCVGIAALIRLRKLKASGLSSILVQQAENDEQLRSLLQKHFSILQVPSLLQQSSGQNRSQPFSLFEKLGSFGAKLLAKALALDTAELMPEEIAPRMLPEDEGGGEGGDGDKDITVGVCVGGEGGLGVGVVVVGGLGVGGVVVLPESKVIDPLPVYVILSIRHVPNMHCYLQQFGNRL